MLDLAREFFRISWLWEAMLSLGGRWRALAKPNPQQEELIGLPSSELEVLVGAVYQGLLGRKADLAGSLHYMERLRAGNPLKDILSEICQSEEFFNHYMSIVYHRYRENGLEKLTSTLQMAKLPILLHDVRVEMVQTLLPPAERVLDIGGAASGHPTGALLACGYPHAPAAIEIVDLPPSQRFDIAGERTVEYREGRTKIRYNYHSMSDLSAFASDSFDLVWSGESIEHVTRDEGISTIKQALRVLKPGSILALDTPNRSLTRLHVGDQKLIHPDHRYEYSYEEMCEVVRSAGFIIKETRGLVKMSRSLNDNIFHTEEFLENVSINYRPESSYLFYLEATKAE